MKEKRLNLKRMTLQMFSTMAKIYFQTLVQNISEKQHMIIALTFTLICVQESLSGHKGEKGLSHAKRRAFHQISTNYSQHSTSKTWQNSWLPSWLACTSAQDVHEKITIWVDDGGGKLKFSSANNIKKNLASHAELVLSKEIKFDNSSAIVLLPLLSITPCFCYFTASIKQLDEIVCVSWKASLLELTGTLYFPCKIRYKQNNNCRFKQWNSDQSKGIPLRNHHCWCMSLNGRIFLSLR